MKFYLVLPRPAGPLPRSWRRATALLIWFLLAVATGAEATVTNVAWYRLGENDSGAASGQVVNSTTTDFVGVRNLNRFGSPVYTNSVASDAAQLGSTLAVRFSGAGQFYSNSIVTTARDNFGIEAWGRIFPTAEGTFVIAHNGRFALNGWGLIAQVQVVSSRPVIAYSAELGAFGSFGGEISRGGWTHVALVRDSGISTLYVDGKASGTTNRTPGSPTIGFALAATPEAPQSAFFPGSIDEVRVFTFAAGQFSTNDLLINQRRVVTLEATDLTATSATMNGAASSVTFPTTVWFEWGTNFNNLENVTPPQSIGDNSAPFSETVTGLTRSVTYYFRAVASNTLGIAYGSLRSFIIEPFVATLPATDVDGTVATLNGVANAKGSDVVGWFEWGTTTNYGKITPAQALGSATNNILFNNPLAGLSGDTTYHFRAVASNALGTAFGANLSFTTPPTTNMLMPREGHTATLLPNGKVLIAGGYGPPINGVGSPTNTAELYDPASGQWSPTGSMNAPRSFHNAILLQTGKVLVVAAFGAELYDPVSGNWTTTGSPTFQRSGATATLLRDGRVLRAGGILSPRCDLYDPATGTWTSTGSLMIQRQRHTATLLPNGNVLVVGGENDSQNVVYSSAELYDPQSGTWTSAASMHFGRKSHTATLLPNGQALVAGGSTQTNYLASVEIYDPTTGIWTVTNSLNHARGYSTATLLPDGKLLIAAGPATIPVTHKPLDSELYDFETGTWTEVPLSIGRESHTATLLPNGNVLLAGGKSPVTPFNNLNVIEIVKPTTPAVWLSARASAKVHNNHTATMLLDNRILVAGAPATNAAEVYNPVLDSWTTTGPMTTNRSGHTATLLPNGKVLAAAGFLGGLGAISSAEVFDPSSDTWSSTAPLSTNRIGHTAALLFNGKVLVAGGLPDAFSAPFATAELYYPPSGKWMPTGSMNTNRSGHTATLLPDGKVLVAGGTSSSSVSSTAELYDPITGTWTLTGSMTTNRTAHRAVLLPNGKVLVIGGSATEILVPLASAELYDPRTGTWKPTGSMADARYLHSATLLLDGTVLVVGGSGFSSVEIYDPATQLWTATTSNTNANGFHASTLLLDGRVLVVGINTNRVNVYSTLFGTNALFRPRIDVIVNDQAGDRLPPGEAMRITGVRFRGLSQGSHGGEKDSSTDYPLMQLRHFESGWSRFLLCTNWSSTNFDSEPVVGFPQGRALLTAFVNGVPSVSRPMLIAPQIFTIRLQEISALADGTIQFGFTNAPGAFFTTVASDEIGAASTNWIPIGSPLEGPAGQYHFTDSPSENRRFYRVRSP